MSSKLKLTPKDCLYIDDALSQLCAVSTRISTESKNVKDAELTSFIDEVNQGFSTQFDAIKKMLKEAKN